MTFPMIRSKNKSIKELIVDILTSEFPLTAKVIYNKIRKLGVSCTYQAVHKAIHELLNENILSLKGKEYQINKYWIDELHEFVDRLKTNYYLGKMSNILALKQIKAKGMQILTFDSYLEADNYRAKLQEKYLLNDEKSVPPYCSHIHHFKSALVYSTKLKGITNFPTKSLIKLYTVLEGDTFIDQWCGEFYKKIFNFEYKRGVKCINNFEFFVMDDLVLELHAPSELWKKLEKIYKGAKHISRIDIIKFYKEVFLKKRKIQMVVYNNKDIAEQIRKQIMQHFKVKKIKKLIKMVVFDVNGVLTPDNTIIEMTNNNSNYKRIKETITGQALGKMSIEKAFTRVGNLAKGLSLKEIIDYGKKAPLVRGLKQTLLKFKGKGIKLIIMSTGFRPVMNLINKRIGNLFDKVICNDLVFVNKNGKVLTKKQVDEAIKRNDPNELKEIVFNGEIDFVINDPDKKTEYIEKTISKYNFEIKNCVSVGDSIADSDMIKMCALGGGLGIAFNPNNSLIEYVQLLKERKGNVEIVEKKDLRKIIPLVLRK